jgi:hypothetical protein
LSNQRSSTVGILIRAGLKILTTLGKFKPLVTLYDVMRITPPGRLPGQSPRSSKMMSRRRDATSIVFDADCALVP